MPNNDAIPMNVVEVLASAELNVNDNSESVAMSVAEGGAGSSGKADKVSGATAGDLAGLDATGNLTDSGKKPADFVAAENFYATQLPMNSTDPTTVAQTATELKSAVDGKASIITDTVSNVAIASVPDAANNLPLTALRFAVEPIQAGSGDPYPAGGGKNKFDPTNTLICRISDAGNIVDQGNNAYRTFYCPTLKAGTWTISVTGLTSNRWVRSMWTVNGEKTITGYSTTTNYLTFTLENDVTDFYMSFRKSNSEEITETIYVQIESGSTATAFAPYSNIRPITGRTSAVVSVTGKNLFDKTANDTDKGYVSGYYLRGTGELNQGADWRISEYIKLNPSTAYTISGLVGNTPAMCFYDKDKNFVSGIQYINNSSITFTTGASVQYLRLSFKTDNANIVQLEQGSTASPYTAYTGTTHPVQFGQTVFGCMVDYVNSKAYVTYVLAVFDGSNDENWNFSTSNSKNRVYTTDLASTIDNSGDVYANYLKAYQNASYPDEWNYQKASASFIIGVPSEINSKDAWKTYLASNNLQICYKLATPIEISLSDLDEIRTVKGQNNIWADCGDVVLMEYPCDTKLYVDKKIAETVALILEN